MCVTGLITLDTPQAFSTLGKVILLLLIQVGGLGIMTFSTAALWALGKRLSLRHEGAVASLISTRDRGRLFDSAREILLLTVSAEGVGAALLWVAFWRAGDAPGEAAFRALFTSISAFCNAGFALQTDSLIPYQTSPVVLHVVAVLVILGGLSPLAILGGVRLLRRSNQPVSAQAKLCLAASAVLLLAGFFLLLPFEWGASLAHLGPVDRLHNAWFQSVTLRTAGFNSVDLTQQVPASFLLMLVFMFIGGSPGGTAGGIKTTTAALLFLGIFRIMRGEAGVTIWSRMITPSSMQKAGVIVTIATTLMIGGLGALLLTQNVDPALLLFEVVSALGTVGLSLGATAQLDTIGKIIIMACMFFGRVGGLTFLLVLTTRRRAPAMGYPQEEIDVG